MDCQPAHQLSAVAEANDGATRIGGADDHVRSRCARSSLKIGTESSGRTGARSRRARERAVGELCAPG